MRLFLSALLVACSFHSVLAQIPAAPIAVLSPNVASVQEHGAVPVSLFTGTPSIGIPLYTIVDGSITVPIELNYRASGVRPDEHPGWVGLNWALNAGGAITRTIKDGPDELNNKNVMYGEGNGYHYTGQNPFSLSGAAWNQEKGLIDIARNYTWYDTEPDEFSFNFPGYSGKFYRSTETGAYGKWQVQCNKPVKVTVNNEIITNVGSANGLTALVLNPIPVPWNPRNPNTPDPNNSFLPTFGGFTITTEDGTQYLFGHQGGDAQSTLTAIEYSINIRAQSKEHWIADAWHLTKITSPGGQEVLFTYQREADYNGMFISNMYSSVQNQQSTGENGWSPVYMRCSNSNVTSLSQSYQGKLIAPVYLSSIQGGNITIRFYRSTSIEKRVDYGVYVNSDKAKQACSTCQDHMWQMLMPNSDDPDYAPHWDVNTCLARLKWKRLDSVQVQYQGQRRKSFALTYNSPSISIADPGDEFTYPDRLMLSQVQEKGVLAAKPPYTFAYYLGTYKGINYGNLPGYVANTNDHWGFYNARYAFPHPDHYADYKSSRNPTSNPTVFLCGTLAKITYPTGGWTEFEFEQHTYAKQVSQIRSHDLQSFSSPQPAGGIRVKRIRNYVSDSSKPALEKEYFYVENFNNSLTSTQLAQRSSGILGGQIEYYFPSYTIPSHNGNGGSFTQNLFSSQPVLFNKNGHIGYTHVVEKRSDGSYIKHEFTNFDNGHLDESAGSGEILQTTRTAYEPYSSTEEERGKLLVEDVCNSRNQTVKRRAITYAAFNKNVEADGYVRAVKANLLSICATGVYYEEATAYKNYTYSYLPMQETETVCDVSGSNCISTSKTYTYNHYKLVASESMADSKGQVVLKTYKYAPDFPYPDQVCSSTVTTNCYPRFSGDPFTWALTRMVKQNMIGLPIETVTYQAGNMIKASVQTYKQWSTQANIIKPYQYFETEAAQPLPYGYESLYYLDPFDPDPDRIRLDPLLKLKRTFTSYDNQGNVLSMQDADAPPTSYVWGYQRRLPLAAFTNASRIPPDAANLLLGNEASYLGFESGMASQGTDPDEDYWSMGESPGRNFLAPLGTAHTGNFAWQVGGVANQFTYGPGRQFSPERQALRYKLSAWVKTPAGFGTSEGRLVLSVNRADDSAAGSSANCYQATTFGNTNGQWRYVEVVLDLNSAHTSLGLPLPTNTERLRIMAYSYNAGAVPYFIDDLRFQPLESTAATYTHTPLVGVTTMADQNGRPVYYEYDGLQRLKVIKDAEGNIIRQHNYNYKP